MMIMIVMPIHEVALGQIDGLNMTDRSAKHRRS